ncbi:nascent polypeptide-associated complex, alpha subunit [Rozella allomycis CSF55]|uniref:Nascent polypeptide-associated complex subunit alpha n=1 Tax=Rozella allomycis (strain CSF55) TaxID=988480 RepID=A0A075AW74_ROZAC|nr:Nascent polypeptide-associated complex subunit alpha domain-containing protein [Rozella allomycis CSF55]RKP18301.1 nascent polypeptide-associated complex, alpha subunit [Rozella allomycis CSF55]|eukprot:EPZ34407.1 Nascent polypeptide-associated complex subunit alpha domain-containing protein [Rozella allomycis CSF55]
MTLDEMNAVVSETHKHTANCKHDDDCAHESDSDEEGHEHSTNAQGVKVSRGEKKARKALLKLGLKRITGITRLTMKRSKNIVFSIAHPEVYKNPLNGTYIVFGEARVEDLSAASQAAAAAERFKASEEKTEEKVETKAEVKEEEDDNENDADATGLDSSDIDMIMSQTNCSRNKAIKALRENNNDVVTAIMELSL